MSEKDPLSLFISEPFFCSHIFGETGPKRTIFRQRSGVDLPFPTMNKPCIRRPVPLQFAKWPDRMVTHTLYTNPLSPSREGCIR